MAFRKIHEWTLDKRPFTDKDVDDLRIDRVKVDDDDDAAADANAPVTGSGADDNAEGNDNNNDGEDDKHVILGDIRNTVVFMCYTAKNYDTQKEPPSVETVVADCWDSELERLGPTGIQQLEAFMSEYYAEMPSVDDVQSDDEDSDGSSDDEKKISRAERRQQARAAEKKHDAEEHDAEKKHDDDDDDSTAEEHSADAKKKEAAPTKKELRAKADEEKQQRKRQARMYGEMLERLRAKDDFDYVGFLGAPDAWECCKSDDFSRYTMLYWAFAKCRIGIQRYRENNNMVMFVSCSSRPEIEGRYALTLGDDAQWTLVGAKLPPAQVKFGETVLCQIQHLQDPAEMRFVWKTSDHARAEREAAERAAKRPVVSAEDHGKLVTTTDSGPGASACGGDDDGDSMPSLESVTDDDEDDESSGEFWDDWMSAHGAVPIDRLMKSFKERTGKD